MPTDPDHKTKPAYPIRHAAPRSPDGAAVLAVAAVVVVLIVVPIHAFAPRAAEAGDILYDNVIAALSVAVATFGLAAALATYVLTSRAQQRQARIRHSFDVLFQVRMSQEFRVQRERRHAIFPEDTEISWHDWKRARDGDLTTRHSRAEQRAGAEALLFLLNYYEFLALGIAMGDLDEEMLRRSLRGIMCNMEDDARFVIAGVRGVNPLAYDNLCRLYESWRRDGARDIRGGPNERPIPAAAVP